MKQNTIDNIYDFLELLWSISSLFLSYILGFLAFSLVAVGIFKYIFWLAKIFNL